MRLFTICILSILASSSFAQNGKPKLIGHFNNYWEPSENAWQMQDSIAIFYNTTGRDSAIIEYMGDSPYTGIWTAIGKRIKTYNQQGKVINELYYNTLDSGNTWIPLSQTLYLYTILGSIDSVISQSFTNSIWQNAGLTKSIYNGNGKMKSELFLWWDKAKNLWYSPIGSSKNEYTYDGNNFLDSKTSYSWNIDSSYHVTTRNSFVNDINGNAISHLEQLMPDSIWYDMSTDSTIFVNNNKTENFHRYRHSGGMDKWGFAYKEIYSYDNKSNNLLVYESLYYDTLTKGWIKSQRITNTYDSIANITQSIGENWDTTQNAYTDFTVDLFYYEKVTIPIATYSTYLTKDKIVSVYPNPCTSTFTIDLLFPNEKTTRVELYDITGKIIYSGNSRLSNKIQCSVTEIPIGIYFLQVINGNTVYTTRVVKTLN